ncbi:MAG: alpha-L-arabinofuranosidase C-terminal domain-containing protein [Hespellia sp.]|nr:alpha-L-arabinofuranosidase C-terminal domain-containing protein [Hespellia sp.]
MKMKIGQKIKEKYIHPELHSQFIEFLGNCISDGIWVGEDSPIPNYDGMRKDVVDALKEIAPPVVRWPGGCYADMYHWRDGVGADRKTTWNENFGTYEEEKNEFGTHEFMKFCELIGAKPWLNINMLKGSVEEMVEWAEYCNRKEATTLSQERKSNGSEEPFQVEFWGIGNECWAGGGNYTAQSYATEYRKYASSMPNFKPVDFFHPVDGIDMKLIACGPDGNKPKERVRWTREFFRALGEFRTPKIHAFDMHFYNWNIKDLEASETVFTEEEWYQVVEGCMELEDIILEQSELIREGVERLPEAEGDFPGNETHCDLIIGEWGNWHGRAFLNRPALYQQCTMRDAVTTALTLDIFHRNCDKVTMACVAQTVNVLNSLILTEGEHMILTPNYYVFEMYKVHRGGTVLGIQTESEKETVYTFASEKDDIISINIVNTDYQKEQTIQLELENEYDFWEADTLCSESPMDFNSVEEPQKIQPRKGKTPECLSEAAYKIWSITVPGASVNTYKFRTIESEKIQ